MFTLLDLVTQRFIRSGETNHAVDMAVADVDGDGRPDLITGDIDGSTISVFRNQLTSKTIPDLSIVVSDNVAAISWPFPSTGFLLESSRDLRASNWQVVPEMSTVRNGRWTAAVPVDENTRYFRLRKQ
jgi:hypothetical protein